MKVSEYDTMNDIINDLDVADIEQIEEYAQDCEMLGAKQTARYIRNQIKAEQDAKLSIIRVKLLYDFSGC